MGARLGSCSPVRWRAFSQASTQGWCLTIFGPQLRASKGTQPVRRRSERTSEPVSGHQPAGVCSCGSRRTQRCIRPQTTMVGMPSYQR